MYVCGMMNNIIVTLNVFFFIVIYLHSSNQIELFFLAKKKNYHILFALKWKSFTHFFFKFYFVESDFHISIAKYENLANNHNYIYLIMKSVRNNNNSMKKKILKMYLFYICLVLYAQFTVSFIFFLASLNKI